MEENKNTNVNQNKIQDNKPEFTRNEKIAVKFPDWDLLPPELLVKRNLYET